MKAHGNAICHVEARAVTPLGQVCAAREAWAGPIERFVTPTAHWLQLSLLPMPRSARGCFPDQWGPHRFERMGSLFFLPADRPLHAKSDCRRQSTVTCAFCPEGVDLWFGEELDWTDVRLQNGLNMTNATMRWLMANLGEEVRSPGFASEARIELMIAQLTVELGRHFLGLADASHVGGLAPWRLRLIDERLTADGGGTSLTELASLCGLSVRQLARGFRASRGCSIGTYLAAGRMDRAKRLLAAGAHLKAVSHAAGFSTPSNFSAAFRRATGVPPGEYRRRMPSGPDGGVRAARTH